MKLSVVAREWVERWRRGNMLLLRLFLRLVPSENQRVFALALIAGALFGLAAVLFHLSIIGTETHVIDRAMHAPGRTWIWWTILTPTLGGLLSGALLKYVVPGARGSGIPQEKVAYAIRGRTRAVHRRNREICYWRTSDRHRLILRERRPNRSDLCRRIERTWSGRGIVQR